MIPFSSDDEDSAADTDDSVVDTDDFPAEATQKEIKKQFALLYEDQRRILVLGLRRSGKSSLIDAMLSANHSSKLSAPPQTNWRIHARELRNDMIRSQYKSGEMFVTEWTALNIKASAVQNMKYFPILQEPFSLEERHELKMRKSRIQVGRRRPGDKGQRKRCVN